MSTWREAEEFAASIAECWAERGCTVQKQIVPAHTEGGAGVATDHLGSCTVQTDLCGGLPRGFENTAHNLSNCMRTHAAAFAAEAAAGRAVYLGVFTVRTKTDPQTFASVVTAVKLQSGAEVRLEVDGRALGIRQHTAWGSMRPNTTDAAAVRAWIEARL
jgi:hypothetical protein